MIEAWVSVGSNVGDSRQVLSEASRMLALLADIDWRVSSIYVSEPWGGIEQRSFLNQVVRLKISHRHMISFAEKLFIEIGSLDEPEHHSWPQPRMSLLKELSEIAHEVKPSAPHIPLDFRWAECLLDLLLAAERLLGRERSPDQERWGPRVIDLDLLAVTRGVPQGDPYQSDRLTLPHPELHRRNFVLEPWAEISPELILPVLNRSVRELWEGSDDSGELHKL